MVNTKLGSSERGGEKAGILSPQKSNREGVDRNVQQIRLVGHLRAEPPTVFVFLAGWTIWGNENASGR